MNIIDIINPLLEGEVPLLQTDSPEFKQWFGASKVVDKTGKPLIMYHGTSKDKDFSHFNIGKRGAWFTAWKDVASDYAMDNDSKKIEYDWDTRTFIDKNVAARVMPVYLKIENPYTMTSDDIQSVNVEKYERAQGILFDRLAREGYDGIQWTPTQWVVLGNSNQIKSAIGNRGTFNPRSKKIHESMGNTIKLTDLYDEDELNDESEELSHFVYPEDLEQDFQIHTMTPTEAKTYLTARNDTTVWQAYNDFADKDQKAIVNNKMKKYDHSRIIVVSGKTVVDGNHQLIAGIKSNNPIKYINLMD